MRPVKPPRTSSLQRMATGLALGYMALAPAVFAWAPGDEARVKADRVNMRARPGLNYEVVLQVGYGDLLTVAGKEGEEWVGVMPPAGAFAWVHEEYVEDGKVSVARLNARSGPGINYSVLGRLGRGADVVPVEQFGEWIKIAAPADALLWVHTEFIEPVAPPVPDAAATGPGTGWVTMPATGTSTGAHRQAVAVARSGGSEVPASKKAPAFAEEATARADEGEAAVASLAGEEDPLPYPPPEGLDLVPLRGQGEPGTYEGSLTRVKYLIGRPSRYELVDERDGRSVTVCYVRGNRDQLGGFMGQRMRITGKTYWVQDLKYPVIVPEKIHLDPPPGDAP